VIRAIDDFLIDRVFQRISDALARWVSCYGIAAFLLTGAILSEFASAAVYESWLFILPGLLGIMWVTELIKAHRMDRYRFGYEAPSIGHFCARCATCAG
jgi:hypothetical protein